MVVDPHVDQEGGASLVHVHGETEEDRWVALLTPALEQLHHGMRQERVSSTFRVEVGTIHKGGPAHFDK